MLKARAIPVAYLAFEGEVRVIRGKTVVSCERLTTRTRGSVDKLQGNRAGKEVVDEPF